MNIGNIPNFNTGYHSMTEKPGYKSSPAECDTCKSRKEIRFPPLKRNHISPSASGARVRAHEAEHVSNAYSKAAEKDGQVVSVGVSIRTAVCPECGRTYTAGGETRTTLKYPNESNPYQKNQKALDAAKYIGANIDYAA